MMIGLWQNPDTALSKFQPQMVLNLKVIPNMNPSIKEKNMIQKPRRIVSYVDVVVRFLGYWATPVIVGE